jgi:hypothetical protein
VVGGLVLQGGWGQNGYGVQGSYVAKRTRSTGKRSGLVRTDKDGHRNFVDMGLKPSADSYLKVKPGC